MSEYTAEEVKAMSERMEDGTRIVPCESDCLRAAEALRAYAATLRQQAERGDVADLTNWQRHYSIGPAAMDALSNLLARLLRAPAEQGGRVDFSEADGAALRSLKVGEVLTEGQWESACRFVRHQDDIIRNLRAALAQNAQGDVVGEYVANIDKHGGVIWRDGPPPHGSKLYLHTKQDALVEELESLLKTPVGAPTSANGLKWCDICCKEVPERWKLVPCEPTVEMLDAGFIAYEGAEFRKGRASWQAMLAAAPSRAERARVPTDSMLAAFVHTWNGGVEWLPATPNLTKRQLARARMAYNAFLAAAPSQPEDAA